MPLTFDKRVRVPDDVLVSDLDGESVILNLKTESYFGLDKVGVRMWAAVTSAESIQAAFEQLADEFDVDPTQLREDLIETIDNLLELGLLEVHP
jgi:hypothetical protein